MMKRNLSGCKKIFKSLAGIGLALAFTFSNFPINTYASEADTVSANELTVSATAKVTLPKIKTVRATDIATTSVNLSAQMVSNGNSSKTQYGFYYGTSKGNLSKKIVYNAKVSNGTLFGIKVDGLKAGTKYYYSAYAKNSAGETLSAIKSFTTKEASTSWKSVKLSIETGIHSRYNANYYSSYWNSVTPFTVKRKTITNTKNVYGIKIDKFNLSTLELGDKIKLYDGSVIKNIGVFGVIDNSDLDYKKLKYQLAADDLSGIDMNTNKIVTRVIGVSPNLGNKILYETEVDRKKGIQNFETSIKGYEKVYIQIRSESATSIGNGNSDYLLLMNPKVSK